MIRVYRIPFSTNVERVALAAGYKGLALEWIDVDPRDRTAVAEASGQELVPVLEAEGEIVVDSTAIVEWLDARFPERPLYPADEPRRAEVELLVDWFNRVWKRPPNLIAAELGKPEPDPARIEELGRRMRRALDLFERLLSGRRYLAGSFGAADCAAFPFLKYALLGLPAGDDELFHRVLVEHQPLGDDHPALAAWIRRVDAHPRA